MNQEFEIQNGKKIPVLLRKKGSDETDPCMFCGKTHSHGSGEGHRVGHCTDSWKRGVLVRTVEGYFLSDGSYVAPKDGYIIREY